MTTTTDLGPYEVTADEFTAAMEAAVADRGTDWTYPKGQQGWRFTSADDACRYVRGDVDAPACLIGDVLHRLGFPLQALRDHEGEGSNEILKALLFDLDGAVVSAAAAAQDRQDGGNTWGQALAAYRDVLAEEAEAQG